MVKTTGDGLLAVFQASVDAVTAAIAGQRAIAAQSWALEPGQLRVRAALLTGAAEARGGDYYGPARNNFV